jgi:hypothetical protein
MKVRDWEVPALPSSRLGLGDGAAAGGAVSSPALAGSD